MYLLKERITGKEAGYIAFESNCSFEFPDHYVYLSEERFQEEKGGHHIYGLSLRDTDILAEPKKLYALINMQLGYTDASLNSYLNALPTIDYEMYRHMKMGRAYLYCLKNVYIDDLYTNGVINEDLTCSFFVYGNMKLFEYDMNRYVKDGLLTYQSSANYYANGIGLLKMTLEDVLKVGKSNRILIDTSLLKNKDLVLWSIDKEYVYNQLEQVTKYWLFKL